MVPAVGGHSGIICYPAILVPFFLSGGIIFNLSGESQERRIELGQKSDNEKPVISTVIALGLIVGMLVLVVYYFLQCTALIKM